MLLYARGGYIVKLALMYKYSDAVKEHLPFLKKKYDGRQGARCRN